MLLMVDSSLPYAQFLPEEGQARRVQIDIDAKMIAGAAVPGRGQERPGW